MRNHRFLCQDGGGLLVCCATAAPRKGASRHTHDAGKMCLVVSPAGLSAVTSSRPQAEFQVQPSSFLLLPAQLHSSSEAEALPGDCQVILLCSSVPSHQK